LMSATKSCGSTAVRIGCEPLGDGVFAMVRHR
jgi:hypothetical protein